MHLVTSKIILKNAKIKGNGHKSKCVSGNSAQVKRHTHGCEPCDHQIILQPIKEMNPVTHRMNEHHSHDSHLFLGQT